ncbi:helix-turn-helix transcriptional regulator [Rhizobium johnstonii]|uniref:helix-turn-helix transcriptional regulator n=1 Tax=Rhizobium johnstonii TaxID=3019933 RepID=UPI003F94961F
MKNDPYAYPPRLMNRVEAARYVGISTTTFDRLVAQGQLPKSKRFSGNSRVMWDRIALDLAVNDLPDADEGPRQTLTQQMLEQYRNPEKVKEREERERQAEQRLWDEARRLIVRDSGVAWGTLANLLGRDKYDPALISEKTGLNIERTGGAWFGTPK